MAIGYEQFCPVAKASEIFATRWTPLILRELMAGSHSFNDLCRGIPLITRAVLVARLRELERNGVVERRARGTGAGNEYRLTEAGEAFRPAIQALRQWGDAYGPERLKPGDLDPALLLWGLRRRVDAASLPRRRVVVRFEFSGVPASRARYRVMWLVLDPSGVDVCVRDEGFEVDLVFRGSIANAVAAYCGHRPWHELAGSHLRIEGRARLARQLPVWLGLEARTGPRKPNPQPV